MRTIYIDEAGDLGFNFAKMGTSKKFVIAALVSTLEADKKIHKAIKHTLKNKVNHKLSEKRKQHELKGTKTTFGVKNYFYAQIKNVVGWQLYALVIDKQKLLFSSKQIEPLCVYDSSIIKLLSHLDFQTNERATSINFDRFKCSNEIIIFDEKLRKNLASQNLMHINHQRSIDNPCLQAVDLFAWGIFKKYEHNEKLWFNQFEEKLTVLDE